MMQSGHSPISDLASTRGTKRIYLPNQIIIFPLPKPRYLNQLTAAQNIFVRLTLPVKAILILNKTMLARPEF